jgi:DNA mismatch repair protein MutS
LSGVTERTASDRPGYKLTPVMQQYLDMKRGHEDAVLFFRLGDFYEMFFEDAERAAALLDLTLTSRNRNDENPIPMCGVPYHSARPYIAKLLEAGVKVAVCEQIDVTAKGIARRQVTRVITPGTSVDEDMLAPDRGNYLAAVSTGAAGSYGIAWTEFSTGELRVTSLATAAAAAEELEAIAPSELLVDAAGEELASKLRVLLPRTLLVTPSFGESATRESEGARRIVEGAGTAMDESSRAALRQLVGYLDSTQGGRLAHLAAPAVYEAGSFLVVDATTRRNLELVESVEGGRAGSLLAAVDRSVTSMGRRRARDWLCRPLASSSAIGERLDGVEWLVERFEARTELRTKLRQVGDLERLAGRIGAGAAQPRDLVRLADAAEAVEAIRRWLGEGTEPSALIARLVGDADSLPELCALLRRALVDDPPAQIGRGPLVRDGFDDEIDRLRSVRTDGKGWMIELEASERRRTGIGNLKVGFNKIFGYYIEVSKTGLAKVPVDYVRKQTVATGERYITDELKRRESELLGAEARLLALETRHFADLVAEAARALPRISRTASALAELDVLAGFAETANVSGYVRPEFLRDGAIEISDGRHPVVESILGQGFVPNDCRLGPGGPTLMVITGPNMAGKSTYMRQVALVVLLAHAGSFVPAARARLPIVDRVFTRIGASDKLARGQSTFMVEMSETAHILDAMTARSLVVLDEIGRGTSTYDGISIAWAVAEAMVAAGVKTLFATHYHERARRGYAPAGVANFSVGVRRYRGEIVFLYRVEAGAASKSYGIDVAALAGVPRRVIDRAKSLLVGFERSHSAASDAAARQPGLFDARGLESTPPGPVEEGTAALLASLAEMVPEKMTPIEALNELDRLVREARKRQ